MAFEEKETSGKKFVGARWPSMPNDFKGFSDTARDSLDTQDLLGLENSTRLIDSQPGWIGSSPDNGCPQSPIWAYDILGDYPDGSRWSGLANKSPSSQDTVTEWMSSENTHTDSIVNNDSVRRVPSVFGHIQNRGSGGRSRSIILRFEAEQRRKRQDQQQLAIRSAPAQEQVAAQDSRTKRKKRTVSTSNSPGREKPSPSLPRESYLMEQPAMDFRKALDEIHVASCVKEHSIAYEEEPEPHFSSQASRTSQLSGTGSGGGPRQTRLQRASISKTRSTQSLPRLIISSSSPKPLQVVMKVNQRNAERVQPTPKSEDSRSEALRILENGDEPSKTSPHSRTRFHEIDTNVMRTTLGIVTEKTHKKSASLEQIETRLRKPSREWPMPVDMGAVLGFNKSFMEQEELPQMNRRDSGAYCSSPEELCYFDVLDDMVYSEHPSQLIPRALSFPYRDSTTLGNEVRTMSPIERLKSPLDRITRHRQYFDNRPLCRGLDGDGVDNISDKLYERLLEETGLYEARQSVQAYQRRAFWDNVRLELRDGDDYEKDEGRERMGC